MALYSFLDVLVERADNTFTTTRYKTKRLSRGCILGFFCPMICTTIKLAAEQRMVSLRALFPSFSTKNLQSSMLIFSLVH